MKVEIYKHDVNELLDGNYNKYSNDGALELKLENIVIMDEDKEFLSKTKKKSRLGCLLKEDDKIKFKRC